MRNSILTDIKKYLGPTASYTAFDPDIIMNINSAFFTLFQLGVGNRRRAFAITDDTATWRDFCTDETIISAVKQYVYLKVRNVFDPPTSSYVLNAYETQIQELEWRLREMAEGSFEVEFPIADHEFLGYVIVGRSIGLTADGRIYLEDVPVITKQFFYDLMDRIFGDDEEEPPDYEAVLTDIGDSLDRINGEVIQEGVAAK